MNSTTPPPTTTPGTNPSTNTFCPITRVPGAPLWGPAAVCAGGRRPAREIATREPAARSGRSRGPPWPCRHPPAPRLGPATAHGHRSRAPPPPTGTAAWLRCPHRYGRALRSLRRPPHQWRLVADVWLGVSFRSPARPATAHGHRRQALRILRHPPHRWHLVCGCVD